MATRRPWYKGALPARKQLRFQTRGSKSNQDKHRERFSSGRLKITVLQIPLRHAISPCARAISRARSTCALLRRRPTLVKPWALPDRLVGNFIPHDPNTCLRKSSRQIVLADEQKKTNKILR